MQSIMQAKYVKSCCLKELTLNIVLDCLHIWKRVLIKKCKKVLSNDTQLCMNECIVEISKIRFEVILVYQRIAS